jgi:hypothetical protein
VNTDKRMSSTYECLICQCQVNNVVETRMDPPSASKEAGESQTFTAQMRLAGCFPEIESSWVNASGVFGISWNPSNSNVATVTGGTTIAVGPGTATIIAAWETEDHQFVGGGFPGEGFCQSTGLHAWTATASFTTQPLQPHHVRVIVDQQGYNSDCPTTSVYLRQIQLQIVTRNNIAITRNDLNISETLFGFTENTCGNGFPVGSGCGPNFGGGTFIDSMAVAGGSGNPADLCNTGINPSSGCGYNVESLWKACAGNGFAAADIWRYHGETRSNSVRVDSSLDGFQPGTQLYPF